MGNWFCNDGYLQRKRAKIPCQPRLSDAPFPPVRKILASLILALACLGGIPGAAHAGDWTLIKFVGPDRVSRDYVTLDNVAKFYELTSVQRVSNTMVMSNGARVLRGAAGSNEFYINNLKFILSYPVEQVGNQLIISRMDLTKIIEPVLRPGHIKGAELVNTIVLDPGHGGHDNGATSTFGNEKTYTLDVALRARDLLQRLGYKVYMTRTTDDFIPLEDRVRYANQFENALFISIHFNSGGTDASGLETYTLAPRGVPSMAADGPRLTDLAPCPGNVCDSQNMALATAAHASIVYRSQMYDRGIKRARFVVIRDVTIPGVLIEGGFLSNPEDARKIATPAYRQQMAACITNAVQAYRAAVGTPSQLARASTNSGDVVVPPESTDSGSAKSNEPVVVTSPTAN